MVREISASPILRNITGSIAEGVQRGRRRKIHHIPKIIGFKVFSGFNAQRVIVI